MFLCLFTCASWMLGFVRRNRQRLPCVTEWEQATGSSWLCVPVDKRAGEKRNVSPCQVRSPSTYIQTPFLPSLSPSVPLVSDILPPWPSSYYPLRPSSRSLSLPSAQSYHTGSLFLANLSLIHYWDLFFFLESQNEEKGTDLLNFWCGAWKM